MISYSIIAKSQLEGARRIDAEYFSPEYLAVEKKINAIKTTSIEDISESVVNFGAYSLCNYIEWKESGVPYLNVENVKEGCLDFEGVKFIDEECDMILKKSRVKEGQVIITMAGTIGNVAVAHNVPAKINSNQATAKITLKRNFSSYFLAAFLGSYYGRKQTEREIVSSVQPNIFLWQIKGFKVPIFTKDKEKEIEQIYKDGLDAFEQSKSLYSQAEDLLLQELGLSDFKPQDDMAYVVSLSKVKAAHRFDAEYFQPKYEKLLVKIKNQKFKTLENFIRDYSTGFPFKSDDYQEEGIPLIRINNIKRGYLDLSDTAYLTEKDYLLSPKDIAKQGDIVLSMSGTIGMCAIISEDVPKSSINQRILRMTIENIDKDYLVLLLNSIIGSFQLERIGTGGVQTNISYKDIKNILIPEFSLSIQQKIADLIRKSHDARKKAKELLKQAKRKVEEMIEKSSG